MRTVTCPLCGGAIDYRSSIQAYLGYKLYPCAGCDVQFWWPLVLDRRFYEEGSAYERSHLGVGKLEAYHRTFARFFPPRREKLLDIGCGDGAFLEEMTRRNWDAYGIDLDRRSVDVAKQTRNLKNVWGMSLGEFVEMARKSNLRFRVITFFEVLEHQDRPREFIAEIRTLLEPGGYIAGSVPNRDRMIRVRESFDYPPNHFTWWSKRTVQALLERNAFVEAVVREETCLKDAIWFLENQTLGAFDETLKRFVKGRILGADERSAQAPIHCLAKGAAGKAELATVLVAVRNALFLLPAVVLYPWLKAHIYFQGRIPA